MPKRATKTPTKAVTDPATHAPSGKPWAFGIRTWDKNGAAHGGFKWNLETGARNEPKRWSVVETCGNGLHCNPAGLGDWSLLSDEADAIWVIVRYDPDTAVDLDGKIKAPWMEVVMTTKSASRASIMTFIGQKSREAVAVLIADAKTKVATKEAEHASAAGDGGHASAAGKYGVAASLGGGQATAADTGAIVLTAWDWRDGDWALLAVFAGMVGQTYGDITIKPDTAYRLLTDGTVVEAA